MTSAAPEAHPSDPGSMDIMRATPERADTHHALVSVIMPAFNAGPYIGAAIRSVLAQSWTSWELIIINDGSTDDTTSIIARFNDPRIRSLHQNNQGVSAARNKGIQAATGEYLAFFDADDVLPPDSLLHRASLLNAHPEAAFADGAVLELDHASGTLRPIHTPHYQGPVFDRLMAMDSGVFFGPTWMVRRSAIGNTLFPRQMSHAEDLAFYLSLSRRGTYISTTQTVLHYRRGHTSAMSDLNGLYRGYLALYEHAKHLEPPPSPRQLSALRTRIRSIMWRSLLKAGRPLDAFRVLASQAPLPRTNR